MDLPFTCFVVTLVIKSFSRVKIEYFILQVVDLEKNIENMRRSPGRKKVNNNNRVRISTPSKSPHRRPQTPPCRLPKGHDDSMAPMEMTDEQFSRKFARRKSIEDGML